MGGMVRIIFPHTYQDIISVENLLTSWQEFRRGKRSREDVQKFERYLMQNICSLHNDLVQGKYTHSPYQAFNISDPKPRNIHKATVRDRLLHHAMYRMTYPFFDRTFISDSFSCRVGKGTHRAIHRFESFARKASKNNTRTVWVLKCDIKKFFASIDQNILIDIVCKYIPEQATQALFQEVIGSFSAAPGKGLPLGNLTSQLLVNIYMNEFDQFVKHKIKAKYYIRYADDFVFLSSDKEELNVILSEITPYLSEKLKLSLHPHKVSISTLASGVDFLGWVHFPQHRVLRTVTKKRMLHALQNTPSKESLQSYLGLLSHGNAHMLEKELIRYLD